MPATVTPGYTFISGDVLTATRLNAAATGTVPNATSTDVGVIQLTGDLSGLATSPTIANSLISTYGRTLTAAADAGAARGVLGLGTLAVLSTINGTLWSGQDLALADGGTGASDAATARNNLGAQAESAALNQITAISGPAGTMIYHDGLTYTGTPSSTFGRSLLAAVDAAAGRTILSAQLTSIYLDQIAAVTPALGTFLYHNGSNYTSTPSDTFGRSFLNTASAALGRASIGIRAWVRFDAAGNIVEQFNVASIVKGGVGLYTVNFSSAMPSANYVGLATSHTDNVASVNTILAGSCVVQMREAPTGTDEDSPGSLVIFHA